MDIYFNDQFFNDFLIDKNELVVYGFQTCGYRELRDHLSDLQTINYEFETINKNRMLKAVYDCSLGINSRVGVKKIDERNFYHINYETSHISIEKTWGRVSKAGITNLIIENCKRKKEGKSIIQLFFAIDIDGNHFKTTLSSLTEKKKGVSKIITYQELRRVYKHLYDSNDLISSVANETFKFVKLVHPEDSMSFTLYDKDGKLDIDEDLAEYSYTPIVVNPPWHQKEDEMEQLMKERKLDKIAKKTTCTSWREQMLSELCPIIE